MPEKSKQILSDLATEIAFQAGKISGHQLSLKTKEGIAKVVQQMNSYYSNLIEGHRTNPLDVQKALKKHFSQMPDKRAMQQLGLAHIEVEELLDKRLREDSMVDIYAPAFSKWIHAEFYGRLPRELLIVKDGADRVYPLEPGKFRTYNVNVGQHIPPDFPTLEAFLSRFDAFYSNEQISSTRRLVGIAAAHHRFVWIHPFGDGNGRVARLLSHAAMIRSNLDGYGLWTLSRGLARNQVDYYRHLAEADRPRWNDYDGRGNLSDTGLADFCVFFLETILDQIQFMSSVLEYEGLKNRIENYVYRNNVFGKHNIQGKYLLFEALREGAFPRGDAMRLTGFKETVARNILQQALNADLLQSDGPRSPVYLGFPLKVCEDYFPKLFIPAL